MKKEQMAIHGKFQSIMELTRKLDKAPKKFGTGELITHSEIHLIEIIGEHDNLSVTDISKALDITKGAVSQSVKRLEKKGYTTKTTDPENLSRLIVSLTAKGQTAFWAHKHWHKTMDGGFSEYLDNLDKNKLSIIIEFLEKTQTFLTKRLQSIE